MQTESTRSADNFLKGKEARTKLVAGISKVADVIKSSYGPHGSNAIIQADLYPFSKTSNDGKAIAESIQLADPIENMGANIAKETADKSDKESGDGRKTSMVLLDAILREGFGTETSPIQLKRELDEALKRLIEDLQKQTVSITAEEVGAIATVASENPEMGELFQDIYSHIGKEGIVELENSSTGETTYSITEGVKLLNCGYMYDYMVNQPRSKTAEWHNPAVLITKQKINSIFDLDKILQAVKAKGYPSLVIFCDEIEQSVSQSLAYLHHGVTPQGQPIESFKTLVIKAPVLWKDWLFEDFAKITGATVVNPIEGKSLKNFQLSYLGTCDKIVTSKEQTVVLGIKDISDHLAHLDSLAESTDADTSRDAKIRKARLQTKTAILKVGANSESELSYLKGKALDARNSSYLALNHGVVVGGGIALTKATHALPETKGAEILSKALTAPYNALVANSGQAHTETDMLNQKVYDSSVVVRNSLTNAVSVASTILTCHTVITK